MTSVRRSQAERSAATREALLDAAIECLVDHGYASTTTSAIAARAGVSRGAHLHHFQTRTALVGAAVEALAQRWMDELRAAVARLPAGEDRTLAGLDLLWAHYASPLFQAAMDLWTDARSDDDLRERLIEVERLLDRETLDLAREMFPALAGTVDFEGLLQQAIATVRGLAILDTLHPDGERNREQWGFIRLKLAALFAVAA
ncbi:MAG TPA: helix-turn-helix domain-containing protein [Solirubrobacter sp.]|nr:helix-turn-helix domain-containing protein [Solirubrobacter sp.]